jgi:DNA-damage-inducible protein J
MANTATFSVRMNPEIKKDLDEFCATVGMTTSTAINLFAYAVVREQRLPFEITAQTLSRQELLRRADDFNSGKNISTHDLIED